MSNQNTGNWKRWGFTCMVVSFFAIVGGLFHLSGGLWDVVVLAGIFLSAPPITRHAGWMQRIFEFLVALVVLFLILAGALWYAGFAGLNAGELLAAIAILIGILLQIWGELSDGRTPDKSIKDVFMEKIKKF